MKYQILKKSMMTLTALVLSASSMAQDVIGNSIPDSNRSAKHVFSAYKQPSQDASSSIGAYSLGCLAGGVALPESGPTWQAMRLSRNRFYGHPALINYIQGLSVVANQNGWAGLYVGDMSQARGGPMLGGHASHQTGLDVDIWTLPAMRMNLSISERENISSNSLVTGDFLHVNKNFTAAHFNIYKAAAQDSRVARIFITPAVKMAMCDMETGDRAWLAKIRPWWGHNDHIHVRLKCQSGSANCANQAPIPAGDGCEEAREFYGMYIAKTIPVPPSPPSEPSRPKTLARMPMQCANLIQ